MPILQAMLSYAPLDDFLEWKMPPSDFERNMSSMVNLSVDGVRFMFAFFFSCLAGICLRHTPTVLGAPSNLLRSCTQTKRCHR
jgi:hypothetical protein